MPDALSTEPSDTTKTAADLLGCAAPEPAVQPIVVPPPVIAYERRIVGRDRWIVTGALMLIMVLASMEMTVTSTAMPTIIGELRGLEHYGWVASIYLLACTVTMPLYGRLADVWGRKPTIMAATVLFTAASVMAAYARSMPQLILFRGAQGLGAGGIMPVVLTILGDLFTLRERAKIQGAFSAVWGLSSLAGPALGAFLVHSFGWRWVFLVNLPFGALGILVLAWRYHDQREPHSTNLDLPGIGLLAVASTALLALVSRLGPGGWSVGVSATLLVVTVVAFAAFVWQERRSANAVMPPAIMLRREIGPAIVATTFFGAGFLALDTFVPLYVQGGRGGSAAQAAAVVTPVMLAWAISNFVGAPLLIRWGFRKLALIGCVLILIGFSGLLAAAVFHWPSWAMTTILAVTGFGFGPASMSYLLGAQNAVEWQHRGIVTSAISFFRTIGGAVGVGVLGAAFNAFAHHDLAFLEARGITPAAALDPKLAGTIPAGALESVRHIIASSLVWVFAVMLALAIAQLVATLLMRGHRAADERR
jgi:MFS family permease